MISADSRMFLWPAVILICTILYLLTKARGNGPFGLPVIGYVPFLTSQPCKKFLELSKTYGSVYNITIWGRSYYVLHTFKVVKEVLTNSALIGRPHEFFYLSESFQRRALSALNGTKWRTHRKFILTVMMGNKAMSQNDGTFLNVAETLVDFMRSTKGQATDYREPLSKTATNAITCALYSKIYDWKDKELEEITKNVRCLLHYLKDMEMLFAGTLFEWFMKIVHWRRHKQILAGSIECTVLFQKMAEKRLREGGFDEGRDFFDHFLANHVKELDDNVLEQDRCFTTESLASTTLNLILAAADTTSETTYWALYFLAKHQNVQQKAQQELDDAIGPRAVAMADRIQLPYMAAFIEETHRMAALFPLGTTRQAVADIDINGVKIQKGSYVIPNIYSCLTDETYFKDPEIFDPSRFIDCNGKFVPIEADIPFTTGRRSCVGETFARVQLFITLCTILQNFNITFPGESCDVSHTDGAFQVLFPHQLCVKERQ